MSAPNIPPGSPTGDSGRFLLETRGLSGVVASRTVVDRVDLHVADSEILTLVGPSGCGKTSLLRLIAGLARPVDGRVILDGRDLSAEPPERRRIGMVFQEGSLFGHLRIDQNIAFGLRHLPRANRRARTTEMLDLVRLPAVARRYPHELSGGEQQRVALARALAPRPRVVLMDEPFASLDEVLRESLGREVAGILRATGTGAILVTHDRREAMALGDRVAVMNNGRILQCDTPQAVYARPVDRFVAGFMGEASFLPRGDGSVTVVRPHEASVSPHGPDTVEHAEYLGSQWRYTIVRADGARIIVDGPLEHPLAAGYMCTVAVRTDVAHRITERSD